MVAYEDQLPLRDARSRYFEANGLGPQGGYEDAWVKVKIGPLPLAFPNTAGRKRDVRYHDLHHVATGYDTSLVGEAEIGAWEIASSCRGHLAAMVLNLLVFWAGLFIAGRSVFRAFVRGRNSHNLYQTFDGPYEQLLDENVGGLRARLGLTSAAPAAAPGDRLSFTGWCFVAAVVGGWPIWIGLALWLAWRAT